MNKETTMATFLEILCRPTGKQATLEKFIQTNQEQTLNEKAALKDVYDAVNALEGVAQFQQMAPRQRHYDHLTEPYIFGKGTR